MTKISGKVLDRNIYTDGGYLEKNPLWHTDESPLQGQTNPANVTERPSRSLTEGDRLSCPVASHNRHPFYRAVTVERRGKTQARRRAKVLLSIRGSGREHATYPPYRHRYRRASNSREKR